MESRLPSPPLWPADERKASRDLDARRLSPLALIPQYRVKHPSPFERIAQIYGLCGETPPPRCESLPIGRCSLPENSR
ncbi:hypothetical protein [Microcoleus sp. AT8-B6]|uniref:hypothetical protein n=1 Tax=Microcoleus sp. AT8-B6 TaxID=2818622 RepID=UPI002FCE8E61